MEGVKSQKMLIPKGPSAHAECPFNPSFRTSRRCWDWPYQDYDDYTFNHSVNVAIYAISLGQESRNSKKTSLPSRDGRLFHDIGKTRIPKRDSEQEWEVDGGGMDRIELLWPLFERKSHEYEGVGGTFHAPGGRHFEHHLKYDLTGYPRLDS